MGGALFYNAAARHRSPTNEPPQPASSLRLRNNTLQDGQEPDETLILPGCTLARRPSSNSSSSVASDPALMLLMRQRGRHVWSLDTVVPTQNESHPISRARIIEILQEALEISNGCDLGMVASTIDGQQKDSAKQ